MFVEVRPDLTSKKQIKVYIWQIDAICWIYVGGGMICKLQMCEFDI